MKLSIINHFTRGLLAAFLFLGAVIQAQAGPGPHETYFPVTTMKQAEAIKPGDRLAIRCGKCGAVTTFTADKDKSYMHGFTCETCHTKFVLKTFQGPHGPVSAFVYEDDAGDKSTLLRRM